MEEPLLLAGLGWCRRRRLLHFVTGLVHVLNE